MKTSTSKNKTGNNAQATLADLNEKIEALKRQRVALADPLKARYGELKTELTDLEREIKDLDETWKPSSLKPKAHDKIRDIIAAKGQPMTAEEVVAAVGDAFTPWKVRNTLKKKSQGAKAVFALVDGKYSVKA